MDTRRERSAPPVLPGSWEDLYRQGRRLAGQQPEEAIPLLLRVFNGLGNLPIQRRQAADGRLQKLYQRSAMSLVTALNLERRYDESLEVVAGAWSNVDEEERDFWRNVQVQILLVDDRLEDAESLLDQMVEERELSTARLFEPLVNAYLDAGKKQEAIAAIDRAQAWVEDRYQNDGLVGTDEDGDDEDRLADIAEIPWLRGMLAVMSQEWQEGAAYFEEVIRLRAPQTHHLQEAYGVFATLEQYEQAQQLIRKDSGYPIRAHFWRGLIEAVQGHEQAARRHWRQATAVTIDSEPMSLVEHVLSSFYLGDQDESGMDLIMSMVDEMPFAPWQFHAVAGIGKAWQGDMNTAREELGVADRMRRSMAEGYLLPYQFWFMCQGLPFGEDVAEELRGYFGPPPSVLVDAP